MDLRPSTHALQRAGKLGIQMAKRERRIIPILSGAHQYSTYLQFITAHRHRLECLSAFEPWDVELHRVAEEEGARHELRPEDPRQWDAFLNRIFVPIRCSFWYGWESVYDLRKLYNQQVELARRDTDRPHVLRVFNPPVSPLIPSSPLPDRFYEDRQWDTIAQEMNLPEEDEPPHKPALPSPDPERTQA